MVSRKFETWELSKDQLMSELMRASIKNYQDAVSRVFEAYARSKGRDISSWGDKNNYYVAQAGVLKERFPEAYFLHITRDVRDVACSYRELMQRPIDSKYKPVLNVDAATIAAEWVENNSNVMNSLDGHPGYMRIRYEDLVTDVVGTMTAVFEKLELPTTGLLASDMHLRALDEPIEFLQWKAKLTGPADSASVGRYRYELTTLEIDAIEQVAGSLMNRYGYTLSQPDI